MRFKGYLDKIQKGYGSGITFIDLDETTFLTFAMIKVLKDGKVIKKLSNTQYNTYKLGDGESFDYGEFRDAKFFKKTSKPIQTTIDRIKRIFKNAEERKSKVVFITARTGFKNMKDFKVKFRQHGIPVDKVQFLFSPKNIKIGINEWKKMKIKEFINTGEYRRVRLIDDAMSNLKSFLEIEKEIPEETLVKMRERYNLKENSKVISYYALHVDEKGKLKRIT